MKQRIRKWHDSLTPKQKIVLYIMVLDLTLLSNIVVGVVIYSTFRALYPHTSGALQTFGLWWMFLTGMVSLLTNVVGIVTKAVGAFRAHRSRSLANNFRDAAHRAMRKARG